MDQYSVGHLYIKKKKKKEKKVEKIIKQRKKKMKRKKPQKKNFLRFGTMIFPPRRIKMYKRERTVSDCDTHDEENVRQSFKEKCARVLIKVFINSRILGFSLIFGVR